MRIDGDSACAQNELKAQDLLCFLGKRFNCVVPGLAGSSRGCHGARGGNERDGVPPDILHAAPKTTSRMKELMAFATFLAPSATAGAHSHSLLATAHAQRELDAAGRDASHTNDSGAFIKRDSTMFISTRTST